MPITPQDAMKQKRLSIPPEVFEAFDELITRNIDISGVAIVLQDDAIERVCHKLGITTGTELTRGDVYKNGWMDVEEDYREAGWEVEYDRPAYYENYDAGYIFTAKDKG